MKTQTECWLVVSRPGSAQTAHGETFFLTREGAKRRLAGMPPDMAREFTVERWFLTPASKERQSARDHFYLKNRIERLLLDFLKDEEDLRPFADALIDIVARWNVRSRREESRP